MADHDVRALLQDVLHELRMALINSEIRVKNSPFPARLQISKAEVEIQFTVGRTVAVGGEIKQELFVLSLKSEAKDEVVHTLKLELAPVPGQEPRVAGNDAGNGNVFAPQGERPADDTR
jgi:hypothetical protein